MDITVHHAERVAVYGVERLMLATEITHDDGTVDRIAHVLPVDILETRAAEYSIDPADIDTLLEIVLYENYLPPQEPDDPTALHNAETIQEARDALITRVRTLRGAGKIEGRLGQSELKAAGPRAKVLRDSGEEDPLAFIKREAPISVPHMEVKREYVRRLRSVARERHARRQAERLSANNGRETPEQLRDRLLGAQPDPQNQPPVTVPSERA